jgi:translation initiation factor 1
VPDGNSRLVYSSDGSEAAGRLRTERPRRAAQVPAKPSLDVPQDGVVRIHRGKKGRGGKTVTSITGLPGREADLEALLKVLKRHCGAGGALEGNVLVIQGDHRERLQAKLESLGHRVKLAGG